MAAVLNIGGSDDPAYRYKMPAVVGKQEGRGNGKKTVIVNAADVGKSLKRPGEYLTKYCAVELGTISTFDKTQGQGCITGWHETKDLQAKRFKDKTNKFIKARRVEWVLCAKCKLPETSMELDSKKRIISPPSASGLTPHCLSYQGGGNASKGKSKEDRRKEKAARQKGGGAAEEEEEEEADDTNVPANELKERAVGSFAEQGEEEEDEDQEWSVDTSADAAMKEEGLDEFEIEKRKIGDEVRAALEKSEAEEDAKARVAVGVKALMEAAESSASWRALLRSPRHCAESLFRQVAEKRELQPLDLFGPPADGGFLFDGVLDAAAVTTLKAHTRLLQKLYKAVVVSGELLVIQAHMRLLQKLYKAVVATPDKKKTQSSVHSLQALVGRVPELEKKARAHLKLEHRRRHRTSPLVPTLLKLLYDADILDDEDVLFKWHEKESKKKLGRKVREAAAPFITWLKEADDESEEESD
ncbi:hypothetical protein EMIHUDRAFT_469449 [Emiliania huxleyi CCMP1516]|uniref:W2 domain-containing protein n=2 Tax=Emiliania huxleyi TaxID=2903 RepID=A0A0D3JJK7_EMIH1|nr:hypothetical protein EMIHUDRAFT_469449 [Emiliania huxleyi CCMP1516]EOD23692.1 hypothetical protein EMIHUDRAFT_469449 [Emiliania huxleyi CCMP1516]|eukprot:XP_005776121.1 hypothetical protein EMIHUDRAFT_469449 [Emiliania huxleyi CCMP1516]